MTSNTDHKDEIEKLIPPFYIRWTSGPDYEKAYLCVEDGEPDMQDFACVPFDAARLFKAAMILLDKRHINDFARKILTDLKTGIDTSVWHPIRDERMKRVLIAESMIEKIDAALEVCPVVVKSPGDLEPSQEEHSDAVAFLEKVNDKDWSLDWLIANVIAQERAASRV